MPSRQWKRRFKRLPWYPGETINIGIGQGYMLATPLQLAVSTAVIARRGERFVPRLVKAVGDELLPVPQLPAIELPEQDWDIAFKSMRNVVHSNKGTAKAIAEGAAYEIAGKTGTAQVVSIAQGEEYDAEQLKIRQRDHALFVGFAPLDNPQIAVAAILENGEKSGRAAAIVRKVFDAYILRPPINSSEEVVDEPQ
jgi:penicillin-binding protein 2